jgi:hypothetical protein
MSEEPRLSHFGSRFLSITLALVLASFTPILFAQSSPVFNGPRDYPVGLSPNSMVVEDFNGDGRPDIATADHGSNNISVLLQNSDGTYQAAVRYAVGNNPSSLQVGDVNDDGKLDLVVINSADNTIGVLLGNGDGTFQAQHLTTIPANSPPQMVVKDFNGDGKDDIAISEPLPQVGNYAVAILLSSGNGSFQAPVTYPVNGPSSGLGVADFNHDGKLDIVSAGYGVSVGISVLLGNGDGSFQAAINSATQSVDLGQSPMLIADFNQDGNLDIAATTAAAHGFSFFTLYLGNGDGTFQVDVFPLLSVLALCVPLATGDLNGDGKPDLIASGCGTPGVSLLNNGDGTFTEGPAVSLGASTGVFPTLALSDLNGDHKLDLVAAISSNGSNGSDIVSVLHGNGDGSFAQFPSYAVTTSLLDTVVAADFNGDGKPDLGGAFVVLDSGNLLKSLNLGLLLNSAVGFLPPNVTVAPQPLNTGTAYVAAGDFNGDGKMDVAEAFNEISILLGKGDGTFQPAVQYGSGMVGPIAVGDFNNDGKLDLVGVNSATSPGVSVLLGKGDGTFGFPLSSPTGSGVTTLTAADFNHDGKLDVAAVEGTGSSAQLVILLGKGDGTFSPGPTYNVGFNPTAVASGDLNGDGIPDLVVGNSDGYDLAQQAFTPSSAVVLLGNGNGTFQPPTTTHVGRQINSIAIADFNLDGKADVVLSNVGWSDVSLLLGNGDGTLQAPTEFFLGGLFHYGGLAVADFDGNGTLDLAVAGENNIFVLLNAAGSHAPAALLSAGTLSFGNESVGQTTSAQSVTLSYMASTALTVTSITITGPQSGDYSQTNNCGASLAAGANCAISVTFSPQATGARTAAIQITDNASNTPQMISLSGSGTVLGIGLAVPSGGANSATVAAGQTASYTLSIGGAGMSGSATLTCTGAPPGAKCSAPATVTVSGTAASTFGVTVATTQRAMASVNSRGPIRVGEAWAAILIGIVLVPATRKKRDSKKQYLGALVVALMFLGSCGGGSSSSKSGTPVGNYNLTVTATLNSSSETVPLKLSVQ